MEKKIILRPLWKKPGNDRRPFFDYYGHHLHKDLPLLLSCGQSYVSKELAEGKDA